MSFEYIIKETDDYYPLSVLLRTSGLGIDIQKDNPPGIVKMWRMEEKESGELAGTIILQLRAGVPCCGGLAVKEEYRHYGCGKVLQELLFSEAKKMGYNQIWTCAKLPDYYLKFGWEIVDWDDSPNIAIWCPTCEKYNVSCFPKIMRKVLK